MNEDGFEWRIALNSRAQVRVRRTLGRLRPSITFRHPIWIWVWTSTRAHPTQSQRNATWFAFRQATASLRSKPGPLSRKSNKTLNSSPIEQGFNLRPCRNSTAIYTFDFITLYREEETRIMSYRKSKCVSHLIIIICRSQNAAAVKWQSLLLILLILGDSNWLRGKESVPEILIAFSPMSPSADHTPVRSLRQECGIMIGRE